MSEESYIHQYGDEIASRDGGWFCHYCHIPLERRTVIGNHDNCSNGFGTATIDHKVPRSAGGKDRISNMVLSCFNCNQEKEDRDYTLFYQFTSKRRARRRGKRGIIVAIRA